MWILEGLFYEGHFNEFDIPFVFTPILTRNQPTPLLLKQIKRFVKSFIQKLFH